MPQRKYIVNDVVKLSMKEQVNAQGKARKDVTDTLCQLGYIRYDIENVKYTWGKGRPSHHYPFVTSFLARRDALKFVERVQAGDVVVLQDCYPEHMQLLTLRCKAKGAKVIFLIHDVSCIRFDKQTEEIAILNTASLLLVHTPAMAIKLKELGVQVPMRVLTLFDYYSNTPMPSAQSTERRKNEVAFAGNLDKSVFLPLWIERNIGSDLKIKLYGFVKHLEIPQGINAEYCGIFQPEETDVLEAGWGLVWDGEVLDTCCGDYGSYLRYNTSHKISLYLACGVPLILWSQSSLANWVNEIKCGITIDDLRSLPKRIKQIPLSEYQMLIANARMIGEKVRKGQFLTNAIQ